MWHIRIIFFSTKIWKFWYLIAICFDLKENLLDYATKMQIWLSSETLQNTSGYGIWIQKINDTSFISAMKGIACHIAWLNAIYSTSVVLKSIYVCILINHNTGHPTYVTTYTVHNMTFSALSASHRKIGIYVTLDYFLFIRIVNYSVCG